MSDQCHNCGKPSAGRAAYHDWEALCPHCGQLLWLGPGDVPECRVTRVTPFGVLVELGNGVAGVIHITELAAQAIRHPEEVVGVGGLLRAVVLRVNVAGRRIGLSCRRLPPMTEVVA